MKGDEILKVHVEAIRDPGYGQSRVDHTPLRKRSPVLSKPTDQVWRKGGRSASSRGDRLASPAGQAMYRGGEYADEFGIRETRQHSAEVYAVAATGTYAL
jgi:hypothetical protein